MKLTHFLMISNAVTLLVVVVLMLDRPENKNLGNNLQAERLSKQSTFEKTVLQNQSDAMSQYEFLADRLTLLEIKLDELSIKSERSYATNLADAPEDKQAVSDSEQKENRTESYSKAQELTNNILSSGTLTVEQSASLMNVFTNVKNASDVERLRKKIIVSINNDELKVEPGVIF